MSRMLDSNVLLDLATADRQWLTWSTAMPDFYIGAHAEVQELTLVTRDAARYRTYFPKVPLIAPS